MEREPHDGALEPDGDYDLLFFDDRDLGAQDARRARFIECALTGCALDELRLDGSTLLDVSIDSSHGTALQAPDGRWQDVVLSDCRLGALVAHGARWARVTLHGGKVDYLDLRGARVEDLHVVGATIDELDLSEAQVTRLRVTDSRIGRLDVTRARLTEVDLRGADLRHVDGAAGLAGATVTAEQLADLAPTLAAHLRITVT